ncbi:MAG TPA: cytochrome C [Frateuria sp.]|uniref:cytochrome C n=1 Tax=Frateuria sp. TaxID=2211372 RepID=UPI002D7E71A9|nr:cytochrome C [Frateuria sp.]HET6807136.1 cytochrome C [Frateuria sp.]
MRWLTSTRMPRCARGWHGLWLACLLLPWQAHAVPSFARQTGQPCVACHVGGFGPQLTAFGRQFKLLGYTLKTADAPNAPLSAMLVESFTRTRKAQAEPPADGFSRNDNVELQQASAFLAGRLSEHLGVFAQATYSENGGSLGWDNIDLRYARTFSGRRHAGIWGVTLNNNPTVSDVFNTAPAWQYPYIAADLAPSSPAQPALFGALGGQVVGVTGYVQLGGALYAEAGGYRSLSPAFLRRVNADFDGRLAGITPYARLAYSWNLAAGSFTLGGFALDARRGLTGEDATGHAVALAGPDDRFRDLGLDAAYQWTGNDQLVTVNALYVHERQRLDATFAAGDAERLHGSLDALHASASYWYRNRWGATLGLFADDGSRDALLYAPGRPDTRGQSLELDWNPFGQADSWLAPTANLRLGAQYTHYSRFAGRVRNIDDAGRRAGDNDTLFLYAWLAL